MQASVTSYVDDFKLMMILSLAAIPLVRCDMLREFGSIPFIVNAGFGDCASSIRTYRGFPML